jgi:hypothetical protein
MPSSSKQIFLSKISLPWSTIKRRGGFAAFTDAYAVCDLDACLGSLHHESNPQKIAEDVKLR